MEQLIEDRKIIMLHWDYYRQRIALGDKSSGPRDWFESVLDSLEERFNELYNCDNNELGEIGNEI